MKPSSRSKGRQSSTLRQTCIGPIRQGGPFKHTKPASNPQWSPYQPVSQLHIGVTSWTRLTSGQHSTAMLAEPKTVSMAAMEGNFHFNATPIAPSGSEMLMHEKPNQRHSLGYNAKKAWYIGPCFRHYCSFHGILPSTGGERVSNTVHFNHHVLTIPQLTPADRILEEANQLNLAIKQQPAKAYC